jgi:hypothetical protein
VAPRGLRNNNPGNIEDGPFAQGLPGYLGSDGRFAQFDNLDNGFGAMDRLLTTPSYQKAGSVHGAISRWAPTNDGNNVDAYAQYVAQKAGVDPHDEAALSNPAIRSKVVRAMAEYENGQSPMAMAFSPEGSRRMANYDDAPALSASGVLGGLGALFGGGDNSSKGYDWGDHLQRAALWLKSVDSPGLAAEAAKPKDADYTLHNAPDGSVIAISKRGGKMSTVLPAQPKLEKIGSGPLGDRMAIRIGTKYIDPETNQVITDLSNPGAAQQPQEGGMGGLGGTGTPTLVKRGVQFDDNLIGDARIDQYDPSVKAAILAYVRGESLPAGGRGTSYTNFIKSQAQRYGAEMGIPVSDADFGARRRLQTELSSGQAGSLGGQVNAGITALGHLATVNDRGKELNNWGTPGVLQSVPGLPAVAHQINAIGNAKGAYSDSANALKRASDLYSGEVTKFYAGSRGTGAERHAGADAFNPNLTPKERETLVRTELELMHSKTSALLAQAQRDLGYDHPKVQALQGALNTNYDKVVQSLSPTTERTGAKPPLSDLLKYR